MLLQYLRSLSNFLEARRECRRGILFPGVSTGTTGIQLDVQASDRPSSDPYHDLTWPWNATEIQSLSENVVSCNGREDLSLYSKHTPAALKPCRQITVYRANLIIDVCCKRVSKNTLFPHSSMLQILAS